MFRRTFVDYFELAESILHPHTIFSTHFNITLLIYALAAGAYWMRHWVGLSDGWTERQ
jgi:hypothetical protein